MEAAYRSRVLAEIDPRSEWARGDEFDTLIVDVSGFTKEQLKVQVEPSGSLKISGERAVDGGRQWCHFLKRFDLPAGCDAAAIKVQLDKGVLYVQMPRPGDADAGGGGGEQQPTERYEDASAQGEEATGAVWWTGGHVAARRRDEHPAWRLAKNLNRHRQVVLNVVLAAVLLWLVAFGKNKPPSGAQIGNE